MQMNIRAGFCTCFKSHFLFLKILNTTLRASKTLMPNIHLLGISVLCSVSKTPGNSVVLEILHFVYIAHNAFATLFID